MVFSFLIFFNIIFLERLLIAAEGTMFFARVCLSAERNISDLSQKKVWWRHSSSQPPVVLNLQEPW